MNIIDIVITYNTSKALQKFESFLMRVSIKTMKIEAAIDESKFQYNFSKCMNNNDCLSLLKPFHYHTYNGKDNKIFYKIK